MAEKLLNQRFSEDICYLLGGINGLDVNSSIFNKSMKVMVFDCNMLCLMSELGALCKFDAAFVVLPDFAIEDRILFQKAKDV